MDDGLRIGQQAHAEWADHQTGRQIAQHGAQPQALEQRHTDDGGPQQSHDSHQLAGIAVCGHWQFLVRAFRMPRQARRGQRC
jgi:hypothetical protein